MASHEVLPQRDASDRAATIIFVLGGPGSGKGTQCRMIAQKHDFFTHICVGDLLQKEVDSKSENGEMIASFKKEGKIVPSEVTVKLLQEEIKKGENKSFLIDGFPRNEENCSAFEKIMNLEPKFVMFFDCPEQVLIDRLINRNQGRVDDQIEIIQMRLKVYADSTMPVIDYYKSKEKVERIDAHRSVAEVFVDVEKVLQDRMCL